MSSTWTVTSPGQSSSSHINPSVHPVISMLTIDLLQALGVAPSNPGSVSSMERGQKRSRPSQEDVLREENKRLRVRPIPTALTNSLN